MACITTLQFARTATPAILTFYEKSAHHFFFRYQAFDGFSMPTFFAYLALYWLIAVVGVWQYFRQHERTIVAVAYEPALESTKLLKDWCTWLATLSTASIGASAFAPTGSLWQGTRPEIAGIALASFGSAIACTATLLLSLPSLVSRLKKDEMSDLNDVYELTAFKWAPTGLAPLMRVGYLAFAQYYFFLVGIACFLISAIQHQAPSPK